MANKVTLAIVLGLVCIGALVLGTTIGQSKFLDLSKYGLGIGIVLYLVFFFRFTWQIVLLLFCSGIRFYYGFALTSLHYCMLLLLVYGLLITLLRRNPFPYPNLFRQIPIARLRVYLVALILWGVVTFALNKISPFPGGAQTTEGMLKAYFDAFMPSIIVLGALTIPYSFRVGTNVLTTMIVIILLSSLVNISHLLYLFSQGYGTGGVGGYFADTEEVGAFQIPLINASFGVYTMRGIGPLAVMISFAALCSREWLSSSNLKVKVLAVMTFCVGLSGALMSGGRAAVLLCVFYVAVLAFVHRRVILIAASVLLTAFIIVVANIFSSFINNDLPLFVARPLQYVMVEKGQAMSTIQGSSDVRTAAYIAGLEEWQSHPRIFVAGRSVYSSDELASEAMRMGSNEAAFVSVALKTGALHALLPSALVQYGLVGTFLYYVVYLALFFTFLRIYQQSGRGMNREIYSLEFRTIAFIMAISTALSIFVATLGGSWFGTLQVVMLLILKSMASRDEIAYAKNVSEEEEVIHQKQTLPLSSSVPNSAFS